jgi:hypothetical protein
MPPAPISAASDGSMVVYEIAFSAAEIGLERALGEFPEVLVESERSVPTTHEPMPYLWTNDGKRPEFRRVIADDPTVDRVEKAATFDGGALYRVDWQRTGDGLLDRIANTDEEVVFLEATGHDEEWTLKFRFPSRARLADFREFCWKHGVDVRVIRLYDLVKPKMGQYSTIEKQREALIRALEMGHFEIPREATLEEVAESLGITAKSVSERLRPGRRT